MGRKQHERVTVIGQLPVKSVGVLQFSTSAQQNLGTKVEYELYAPADTVAETDLMNLVWGSFATNTYGSKTLALIANNRTLGIVYGVATVDQPLRFTYGQWENISSCKPANQTSQYLAQKGVVFSDTNPLVIQFDNTSTANSISERSYFIRYSYEKVIN